MENIKRIEKLLKNHEYKKVRVEFLLSQKERLSSEDANEYIRGKMLKGGYSGSIPKFMIKEYGEIAKLNHVEETADNYQVKIEEEYKKAIKEIDHEINTLKFQIGLMEEALNLLKRMNEKFFMIIQKRYLYNCTMENIAESMHLSRSRCYELRKSALEFLTKIICGEQMAYQS